MLIVRNVFRLKYGQAKPALAAWKEGGELLRRMSVTPARLLTDVIGPAYTVVLESSYDTMQAFEAEMTRVLGNAQWSKWYHEKWVPHVESGYREVLNLVE